MIFLFIGESKKECQKGLYNILHLCKYAKIPVAAHKTGSPTTRIVLLEVQLDTQLMLAYLPLHKLLRYSSNISNTIDKQNLALHDSYSMPHV